MRKLTSLDIIEERLRRSVSVRCIAALPKLASQKIGSASYKRSRWPGEISRFKDIHKGERCFIVGNGPSLELSDLERLENEVTFCANLAYRLFENTTFRPTYYVAADKFFFPKFYQELIQYKGIEDYFFAKEAERRVSLPDNAHCINITGPFTLVKGSMKNDEFSNDLADHFAMSYTVTYYSLQLAAYMGFETIYLIGVDHNYVNSVDENGVLRRGNGSNNSYAKGMGVPEGSGWNYVDSTTHSYKVANMYALTHGFKILNATRGGNLEVFPRINFDTIV